MVTAPVAASLGCPAWIASVSKRYMFPLLPHNAADLTLLTCRGEKLQEGPGSRRQSVYASAPGRGINIRRVVRRDMGGRVISFSFEVNRETVTRGSRRGGENH